VAVLTPNPRTSGGAMWNVAAIYGAALRGGTSRPAGDTAAAEALLSAVIRNVKIMDKGGRESILSFESGVGDVAITYENEVLVAKQSGAKMDYVIPPATLLIENPIAVIDGYADKHKTRDLAEAFVSFLHTGEAQRSYAKYGLRPVVDSVAKAVSASFPVVPSLFTIRDLGGWPQVVKVLFAPNATFDRLSSVARAQ
jgi:sulfate/thiosulfate transport system substrate-binding protein